MRWLDLLFAHWPIDPAVLRPFIPAPLALETFDGSAWLGVVPFRMTHVRPFELPLPGRGVRVRRGQRPDLRHGARRHARDLVPVARRRPLAERDGRPGSGSACRTTTPGSRRPPTATGSRDQLAASHASPAELRIRYRPTGPVRTAAPGSLEAFLTDRMSLFAVQRGRVTQTPVEHAPWPLQDAEAEIERNTMAASFGIELPATPPHLLASRAAWTPSPTDRGRSRRAEASVADRSN